MNRGKIYVIAAPSGAGKSTLVNALCKLDSRVQLSISHTTRPKRMNEENGINYFFISISEFEAMIENNEFLEYAKVYDNYYGTNINTIKNFLATGKDILLEIDWQGARQIRKLFHEAVLIFILPPSLEVLEQRLRNRNTDSIEIINDNFDTALQDLWSVIRANRNKTSCLLEEVKQQFKF
jgi:guanylate kinase